MNDEQFKRATQLKNEKFNISKELEVWERELTKPSKLGYLQGWNNNHATELKTNIPVEVFDGFRLVSMNALKLRLTEIEQEFKEI